MDYILIILILAILLVITRTYFRTEPFNKEDELQRSYTLKIHGETDPTLRKLYKRLYNLEMISRTGVDRDTQGGAFGVSREKYYLESIERNMNELRNTIADYIKKNREPTPITKVDPYTPPKLYTSNPMIGLPSNPGSIHGYLQEEV